MERWNKGEQVDKEAARETVVQEEKKRERKERRGRKILNI